LDPDQGRKYVADFFGIDGRTFQIIPGEPVPPPKTRPLPRSELVAIWNDANLESQRARIEALERREPLSAALANACNTGSRFVPTSLNDLNVRLFDEEGAVDD